MSTTQAFRNALHIPFADPTANQVVATVTPGDAYQTGWANGAAGGSFPNPDAEDQILASGTGPTFAWRLTRIDAGEY